MDSLEQIQRRLTVAGELSSVVRTMKTLAAINLTQYEKVVGTLLSYEAVIQSGFRVLESTGLRLMNEEAALGEAITIVFGANQGLCGNFNRQIVTAALGSSSTHYAAVGQRAAEQLERHDHTPHEIFGLPSSLDGINHCLREILVTIDSWLAKSIFSIIHLVYHRMTDHARYEPVNLTLIPFSQDWLRQTETSTWPTNQLPTTFQTTESLRSSLIRQFLYVSLFRAFAESLRSENAARMAAMQLAEKNIEEKQQRLRLDYHRHRQEAVTRELIDVVTGAEPND
jgi:F-type H+-transporting ATPase subunit gamma